MTYKESRPTKFGQVLFHYLKIRRMSQKSLAIKSGVGKSYISQLINRDDRKPSLQVVLALIKELKLTNEQKMDFFSSLDHLYDPKDLQEEFSLYQVQLEHMEWVSYNFPNSDKIDPILGVCEEAGELAHAALKMKQNIRGSEQEHRDELEDAIGDIIIYLLDVCNKYGFNIERVIQKVWNQVKQRDWQKNKQNGKIFI